MPLGTKFEGKGVTMRNGALAFMVALTLLVPVPLILSGSVSGADRSGDYPLNFNIQDYEPSADDQWDLDVAQGADGRFYAVWADSRMLFTDIRFSKSSNGTSWGDGEFNNNDIIVNDDSGQGADHLHPSIAVDDNGRLYCTWLDSRDGDYGIRIATSNNSGALWSSSRAIENITGAITEPYIRWSSGAGLCLVFTSERQRTASGPLQKDIMFSRSTDEGLTFSTPVRINDDQTDEEQSNPRMVVSGSGTIGIVWRDFRNGNSVSGTNSDIFIALTEDGAAFGPNICAGTDLERLKQENPDIAFSANDDVIVAWQEDTNNGWRVRYSIGWSGSPSWDGSMTGDHPVAAENLSRLDQFRPRVGYIDGAFAIAWTEYDIRNFFLVRLGYLSRAGDVVSEDHIIDDTIDKGHFINDPDIFIAEMPKETVMVLGQGATAQVFWLDFRTDPNPSNDIAEDSDPYTARATFETTMPKAPADTSLRVVDVGWDHATITWDQSQDIELKGYYLTSGIGQAPMPDERLNNWSSNDRMLRTATLTGLRSNMEYEFRLMVSDSTGQRNHMEPLKLRTQRNNPPTFIFLDPDGTSDEADTTFHIKWSCTDPEEVAHYEIHYDTDLEPSDQIMLASGTSLENGGQGDLEWNTTALAPGGYTLNATSWDGVNPPVTFYSPAIIVTHPKESLDHPRVVSAFVEGGKDNAYVDPFVRITFNHDMSPVSFGTGSFYVLDGSMKRVDGAISIASSKEIEWRPSSDLLFGVEYNVVMTPSIKDVEGVELDGENIGEPSSYRFSFWTRPVDGPLEIRSWSPQGPDALLWPTISIGFDKPIAPESLGEGNLRLAGPEDVQVKLEVTLSEDHKEVTATTMTPLAQLKTYTVNLSESIRSTVGVTLGRYIEWSFTTGTPNLGKDRDDDGAPDDLDWFPDDPSESEDTDVDGTGNNLDLDDDGDGMPDDWEGRYDLDPLDPSDAELDEDDDGYTNLEEYREGSDPTEKEGKVDTSYLVFIIFIVGVLLVALLAIYAVVQRRRLERERQERTFFKEE